MKSLTYYLTLLVIKIKGVKSIFSGDPVNYKKLRKEDLHDPGPGMFRPIQMNRFQIRSTTITELTSVVKDEHLIIFCHGGAFVYGPVKHHWDAAKKIVSQTGCSLWLADYPKAPETTITSISADIDMIYARALESFDAKRIVLLGDSVGGTLILSLTQQLIQNNKPVPGKLILLSPVMDATFKNPEIKDYDKKDPILSREGVLSAKRMCAGNHHLDDPRLSPLNGTFLNFPETVLFLAENDITFPDQQIAVQKMKDSGVNVKSIIGYQMPHIWPILPVMKEAREAFCRIISEITAVTGK